MAAKKKNQGEEPKEAPDAIKIGESEVAEQRKADMIDPATMTSVEERQARNAEAAPVPSSRPVGDPEERLGPGVEPATDPSSLIGKGLLPSDSTLQSAPDLASRMAHEQVDAPPADDPNRVAPKKGD